MFTTELSGLKVVHLSLLKQLKKKKKNMKGMKAAVGQGIRRLEGVI